MKKNLFLLIIYFLAITASAENKTMPSNIPKSYEAECASCHMAYPPGLLGQKNWQNMMSGLNKHFGVDASLDTKTQIEIEKWLVKNAATKSKYSEFAQDNRITKSAWFIHEHEKVKTEVWKRGGVKSQSNCIACHSNASQGTFEDDNVRIPAK
jgi:nitrate/TMAO reductase-like tetraheme cytochrome c subunit